MTICLRRGAALLRPKSVPSGMLASLCFSLLLCGCGYHVAGRTNGLPKTIHVIAVPPMENKTPGFKVEQILTKATIHDFLAATPYKVVSDPNGGDAVLTAKVLTLEVVPLIFQSVPQSTTSTTNVAQATAMMITMKCEVTLTERDDDRVLYHNDNFVFRNQYQLGTQGTTTPNGTPIRGDVEEFFQENEPAVGRMAQDFATRLVAAVVENY
jgi:outer membrane lipopolysaccharide assembly protein LptE/RlpB